MNATRILRLLAAALALTLLAAACSGSRDADDSATLSTAEADLATGEPEPTGATDSGDSPTVATDDRDADTDDGVDAPEAEVAEFADADDMAEDEMEGGDDESISDAARSSEDVAVEPLPIPEPEPQPEPQAGLLTAADVDDNLNLASFGRLSSEWQVIGPGVPQIEVRDRIVVDLLGTNGVGIGNTALTVTAGQSRRTVVTDSAGRAYLFPSWLGLDIGSGLEIATGGNLWSLDADDVASGEVALTIDGDTTPPSALDVALVLDVTGSMADELRYLTVEFESIVARVEADYGNVDMRFALVVYRDAGDDFVTRSFDFTGSVAEVRDWLAGQVADGGGDFPEAMDAALAEAEVLSWRPGDDVARVLILNADAPPHDDRIAATLTSAQALGEDGVRIYPLAASGVDRSAEFLMRAMAVTTGGRHLFLTSDSGIGGEKLEPKADCYVVTDLDDLLYRVLASELAGERIEPTPEQILRTVGDYDRGVCGGQ